MSHLIGIFTVETVFFSYTGEKSHSIEDRNEYINKQLSILDQKLASKVITHLVFYIKYTVLPNSCMVGKLSLSSIVMSKIVDFLNPNQLQ